MTRSRRSLVLLILALPVLVLACAWLYQAGMAILEEKPRNFWDSLGWAAETLTTTGYGADSHWRHPAMAIYVVVVQFLGVFLVFLIVPIYLIPFLEERFETRLPQEAPPRLAGHVVVYRYGPAVETLLQELREARVSTLVIEEEDGPARRLSEAGQAVLHRPLDDAALRAARLSAARALIANGSDDANAALCLAARQLDFAGPIYALAEEPFHRKPLELAGATAVFTPRHILGAALAARASAKLREPGATAEAPALSGSGPFIVCGYGEVGQKVVELLRVVGEEVRVIDRRPGEGVERVGNVLDPRTLEPLGLAGAQAVILALDSDSATLFATVILRELVPEVPIFARVNEAENIDRIHRAGASFALSISQVSGQLLARKLLREEA